MKILSCCLFPANVTCEAYELSQDEVTFVYKIEYCNWIKEFATNVIFEEIDDEDASLFLIDGFGKDLIKEFGL